MIRFLFTDHYNRRLEEIEDFIFQSMQSLHQVQIFLDRHDDALKFIENNPDTPAIHPATGDQSWIFGDGRYRLFFRVVKGFDETVVYLTHLIDNRQSNLDVYPENSLATYLED